MAVQSEVEKLASDIRFGIFVLLAVYVLGFIFPNIGSDDTDPEGSRSGLRLLTDAKTGCQYLSRGGLTPRLDADGKHVGCRSTPARED